MLGVCTGISLAKVNTLYQYGVARDRCLKLRAWVVVLPVLQAFLPVLFTERGRFNAGFR
jgi:hypothetical protein